MASQANRQTILSGGDEWRRHWQVVAASVTGITLCSFHGYSIGVMIGPLEDEFGWSRAAITGGLLIIAFIAVFVSPLVGRAVDRIGPRKVALLGVPFFCTAFAMLSLATPSIYSWWALWALLGFANMCVLPTVWTAAINSRFDANRGLALALALSGTGISAFFMPPLANYLAGTLGWRGAYVSLAAIGFIVVFPLVLLCFRAARDMTAEQRETMAPPMEVVGSGDLRTEMRSPRFLKLLGASTFFSITICALTTNAVPVLLGQGFSRAGAAEIAALIGLGSIIGRVGGGFLLDRIEARKVAAVSVLAPIITAMLILFMGNSEWAARAACLTLGLAVGTEVDACAYLAARHFGMRNFGALFGTINGLMLLGNGIAPFAANYIYDITHTYDIVLWAQLPACLASAVLFLMMGAYPEIDRSGDPA